MSRKEYDEEKQVSARRRLLKALTATGGVIATGALVPREWASPVVKSVLLPAHAQTSPDSDDDIPTGNFGAAAAAAEAVRAPSVLDLVVPAAYAGGSAMVGNVSLELFYTVFPDEAVICGEATFKNATVDIGSVLNRSGNSLENHEETVGSATLSLFDQSVSEAGVSLTASANKDSAPLFAPPGPGCLLNATSRFDSSSPFPDDDKLA